MYARIISTASTASSVPPTHPLHLTFPPSYWSRSTAKASALFFTRAPTEVAEVVAWFRCSLVGMNLNVTVDQLIECCVTQSVQAEEGVRHSNPDKLGSPTASEAFSTPKLAGQSQPNVYRGGPIAAKVQENGISNERTGRPNYPVEGSQELEKQYEHPKGLKEDWTSIFQQGTHENRVSRDRKTTATNVAKTEKGVSSPITKFKPETPPAPASPEKDMTLKDTSLLDGYEIDTGEFAKGKCGGAEAVPMLDIFRAKNENGVPAQKVGLRRVGSTRKLNYLKSLEVKDRKLEVLARKYRDGCALVRGREGKTLKASWILGAIRSLLRSEREERVKDVNYMRGKPPLPRKRISQVQVSVDVRGKKELNKINHVKCKDSPKTDLDSSQAGGPEHRNVGKVNEPQNISVEPSLTDSSRREMLTALRQRLSKQQLRKSIDGALDETNQSVEIEPAGYQNPVLTTSIGRARRSMEEEKNWFSLKFSPAALTSASASTRAFAQPSKRSNAMHRTNALHNNPYRNGRASFESGMQIPSTSKGGGVCLGPDEGLVGAGRRKSFAEARSGGEGMASVSKARLLRKATNGRAREGEIMGRRHDTDFLKLLRTKYG
ncbi:hypothetical protein BSKO_08400 [Bryopsis sp. KO-2023]|nr:hypothetical protein BSKO_08400 [Bryopsis sp. KO-2023]